jgi:hypothetical protein
LATITDVTYVFIDPRIKYASANEWQTFAFLKNKRTRYRNNENAGVVAASIEADNEEEEQ